MQGVLRVDQHGPQCLGEGVGAPVAVGLVGRLEQAGHGLLLEPLPGVALGDAGARGQVGGSARACLGQPAVEAESSSEVDGEELERARGRRDEVVGELGGL